jgi:hypothetical protein
MFIKRKMEIIGTTNKNQDDINKEKWMWKKWVVGSSYLFFCSFF